MTLAIPTASSIKMRFPEFSAVDDQVVEFAIEEARLEVSDDWTANGNLALVYLTAHYVACSVARAASGGTGDSAEIASESIGRLSISYRAPSTSSSSTSEDKDSTTYGRRFIDILGANFSGPLIV
jgi:hypothetical protein